MAVSEKRSLWQRCKWLARFVWPRDNRLMQLQLCGVVLMLILPRLTVLAIPVAYKCLIGTLNTPAVEGKKEPVWWEVTPPQLTMIVCYVGLKALNGGNGLLSAFRSYLWLPIAQMCNTRLRVEFFRHILNLSFSWHLQRKTGEVLRVVDRGVTSVEVIINEVVFSMGPAVADVAVFTIFFLAVFDVLTGLIVALSVAGYVTSTLVFDKWKYGYRRQRNEADSQRHAVIVDAVLNFETVKLNAAEEWEVENYRSILHKHEEAECRMYRMTELLQLGRRCVTCVGLALGSLVCAAYINRGTFTVGDYVLFATYLEKVFVPLNHIGDYYKRVQQAVVDMENMIQILDERPDIVDSVDAAPLLITGGRIEFCDVHFHYVPGHPVLRGLSWTVNPGQMLAIVGPSGAGKSTVMRLLLRMYDVSAGAIYIDGQDIRKVAQGSLRKQVGVVPQDTVLFNKDINYNIKYGCAGASEQQVEDAAESADIHWRVTSFPDGYATKVGERGVKLSGGEKQRVAIARMMLKAAKIIILDEATSALDTHTERNIQEAISRVCANKTTVCIAHRLSTIVHADMIIVVDNGRVVESGTHQSLLELGGRYSEMWLEQLRRKKNKNDGGDVDSEDTDSIHSGNSYADLLIPKATVPDSEENKLIHDATVLHSADSDSDAAESVRNGWDVNLAAELIGNGRILNSKETSSVCSDGDPESIHNANDKDSNVEMIRVVANLSGDFNNLGHKEMASKLRQRLTADASDKY